MNYNKNGIKENNIYLKTDIRLLKTIFEKCYRRYVWWVLNFGALMSFYFSILILVELLVIQVCFPIFIIRSV